MEKIRKQLEQYPEEIVYYLDRKQDKRLDKRHSLHSPPTMKTLLLLILLLTCGLPKGMGAAPASSPVGSSAASPPTAPPTASNQAATPPTAGQPGEGEEGIPLTPCVSIVTTSDYFPLLSDEGRSQEGHDFLYSPELASQIECTYDGREYHYHIIAGQEDRPLLHLSPQLKEYYCHRLSELDEERDYFPVPPSADGSPNRDESDPTFRIISFPKEQGEPASRSTPEGSDLPLPQAASPQAEPPTSTSSTSTTSSTSWWKSGWAMIGGATGSGGRLAPWEAEALTIGEEAAEGAAEGAAVAMLLAVAPEVEVPALAFRAARAARAAQAAEATAGSGIFSSLGRSLGRAATWISRSLFGSSAQEAAGVARGVQEGARVAQEGARAAQGGADSAAAVHAPVVRTTSLDHLGGDLPTAQATDGSIEGKVFADDQEAVEKQIKAEEETKEWFEKIQAKNRAETQRKRASGELQREIKENGAKVVIKPGDPGYNFMKSLGVLDDD